VTVTLRRAGYAVFLLLCAEVFAKALLLLPWTRARLPPDDELSWRARWVGRYVFAGRPIFYHFDVHDPLTGWALQRDLRGFRQFPGSTVDSNSRGIRGRAEHVPGRRPGGRRIVALGDSFTFGEGVGDEEAFPHLLQGLLPGAEVINLGVHGYGHDQMLLRFRAEGRRYEPDLVLLGFFADDVGRNLLRFRDYAKPRFTLENGALVLGGTPVPPPPRQLLRETARFHLGALARTLATGGRGADGGTANALAFAILDAIRAEAAAAGARFLVAELPAPAEISLPGRSAAAELLELFARTRDVPVCYTGPTLRARVRDGARYRATGHYDAAAHRDVAAAIAGCVRDAGLLDPPRT
jgi:hypothetical protein